MWHSAFSPQDPGQGSTHFKLTQAKFFGQSGLVTHSGLQLGGLPRYDGRQEHFDVPIDVTSHREFGPQGDGTQGFCGTVMLTCGRTTVKTCVLVRFTKKLETYLLFDI